MLVIGVLGCTAVVTMAQTSGKGNTKLEHGKYLVNQVGLCADCHSPRDQKGEFIKEKWLEGAPIMFSPSIEIPWAGTAPPLAGLEGWTDAEAMKFLTTGIDKDGKNARPPMPPYRFSESDASAVLAYLRSLKQPAASQKSAKQGQ
ncbi:MAG TPA: c-type cytochrome [Terriglobales bacterium]